MRGRTDAAPTARSIVSLLIATLEKDRALVAVDTAGRGSDGVPMHAAKLFHLPHIGSVVAGRGVAGLSLQIALCLMAGARNYEEARALIIEGIPLHLKRLQAQANGMGELAKAGVAGTHEVILMGWAATQGRMAGTCFVRPAGQELLSVDDVEVDESIFSPGAIPDSLADPRTPAKAIAVAQHQVRVWRQSEPDTPVGGDLVVCQISKDCAEITTHRAFMGD